MAKKAATANKARATRPEVAGTVNEETVVYVDKDGNEIGGPEEATNGARVLRGEEAEKYLAGEALPQYGIASLEGDDDGDAEPGAPVSSGGDA